MRNKYFLLIAIFILFFSLNYDKVEFDFQHTKAICEKNVCRDYLITCKNSDVTDIVPISGLVIFDEDWQDTREDKKLCD